LTSGSQDDVAHAFAAIASTSTLNSGRVNPETIISVDAGGVAHRHVRAHMGAVGHVGIDPHDIGKGHARLRQAGADRLEAQGRLRVAAFRNLVVRRNAELPRAHQPARAGRDLDRMAVAREWRTHPGRHQMAKCAHVGSRSAPIARRSAAETRRQRSL
jgi:hypothetical protein